jgi:hypothetical protein
MYIGTFFWLLVILYLLFRGIWWRQGPQWSYGPQGDWVFLFLLIFLLGWAEFGFILQGGGVRHPF